LVGRILIRLGAQGAGWRGFAAFIARRALRTLPLYVLWLAVLLAVFPPRQDVLAVGLRLLTLTQNFLAPMPADYYFAVSWSLTIECWFYLLFGAAYLVAAHAQNSVRATRWCLAGFLLAPLIARLLYGDKPALVPFRLDDLIYGVLFAKLAARNSRLLDYPRACFIAGLAVVTMLGADLLIPALHSNTLVAGCALCLPAAVRINHLAQWLAVPVRWIASRSYALYLIHLTILADVVEINFWQTGLLPVPACIAVAMLLPCLLAELSYRLLERPLLRLHEASGFTSRYHPPAGAISGTAP
ncbi:MAG: acyltransferase, partial [Acetobacteraceae bacterium]|nr:acyltransferase [Acetobacteraceae bacterium]